MNLSLPDHLKITLSPEQPFYHLECYLVMRSNCKDTEAINRWRLGRAKHEPRRSGGCYRLSQDTPPCVYTTPHLQYLIFTYSIYWSVMCVCTCAVVVTNGIAPNIIVESNINPWQVAPELDSS